MALSDSVKYLCMVRRWGGSATNENRLYKGGKKQDDAEEWKGFHPGDEVLMHVDMPAGRLHMR
jgi:hypothetical protein